MELTHLTINFLGDSITEGYGVNDVKNCFVSRIAAETGCICRNYGISGTRIARQKKASVYPMHDLDFVARVPCMGEDADLIVVFGGTNDFGHGDAPLGCMDDRDVFTFYGALHTLYSSLKARYSGKPIVVITPLQRARPLEKSIVPALSDYVDIIKQVAAFYDLPVLDLFQQSRLHPRTEQLRERYLPDGLHPNDEGHAILASEILTFLQAL